jgi:hypothetical protein
MELECGARMPKTLHILQIIAWTIASDSVVVSQIWFDIKALFQYSIYVHSISQRDIVGFLLRQILLWWVKKHQFDLEALFFWFR